MADADDRAQQRTPRALIVGAGPAGLTAALALRRIGIPVAVFERSPKLSEIGAGLGVQSNALRALEKIGVGEAIVEAGDELRRQEVFDIHGKLLYAMPKGEVADEFGTPTISVTRADLQRALVDALDGDVVQLGCECVSVQQDGDAVSAVFADGRSETGALLIGADGGRSAVREYVYDDGGPPLRYTGMTSWRSVVEMDPGLLPPATSRTYIGRGTNFAMFSVGRNRIYWGVMKCEPEGGRDAVPGLRDKLLDAVRDFPDISRTLINATDETSIVRTDVSDRDPKPGWVRGRVVLIGDAAHLTTPFLGQGAGISIEDAVVLAKELSLTRGLRDQRVLEQALASFEQARLRRCTSVVMSARQWSKVFRLSNPTVVFVRDAILTAVPRLAWRRAAAKSIMWDV